MIKVIVKNLQNNQTHGGQFETQEAANSWINDCITFDYWGKKAGFYPPSQLSEAELAQEISRQESEFSETLVEIPAQYTIESLDITTELALQQSIQEGIKRQEQGKLVLAAIFAINEAKDLSAEQFTAILNDANLLKIERLLINGSLRTAKLFIQALDNTYYTNEEKQTILNMLGEY